MTKVKEEQGTDIIVTKAMETKWTTLNKTIETNYKKVEGSYLAIAGALAQIHAQKLFQIEGYQNVYDYSSDMWGMARGTTSDLINIIKTFGDLETGKLLPEYSDYNVSQLRIMRQLPAELLVDVKPTLTVRELKTMLEQSRGIEAGGEYESTEEHSPTTTESSDVRTSEQPAKPIGLDEQTGVFKMSFSSLDSMRDNAEVIMMRIIAELENNATSVVITVNTQS